MPDLGKYAATIYMAYGVTIVLLAGIILTSVLRARKTKAQLDALEARRNG